LSRGAENHWNEERAIHLLDRINRISQN